MMSLAAMMVGHFVKNALKPFTLFQKDFVRVGPLS